MFWTIDRRNFACGRSTSSNRSAAVPMLYISSSKKCHFFSVTVNSYKKKDDCIHKAKLINQKLGQTNINTCRLSEPNK